MAEQQLKDISIIGGGPTGLFGAFYAGAAEACIAVNNAVHVINPKAKVNPGHSSNMAIFGQKDD